MSRDCPFCGDCEACQRTLRNEDKMAKLEKRVAELEAALGPFAECWRNFKSAPVSQKLHPRFDPIACAFEPWRNADAAKGGAA